MISIFSGTLLISILHALIPSHWLPITALSHTHKWTKKETLLATFYLGLSHVASTLLLGLIFFFLGKQFEKNYGHYFDLFAPIGLIIIGKFSQAAMGRVDQHDKSKNSDFFLYIDEFYNFTTPAIASILSEARKYRLSLTVAHQFIGQLTEEIKGAVFGNVGSMAIHRVSPEDAKYLESKFEPTFTASDIMKISNLNAYLKLLAKGEPKKPFDVFVPFPPRGDISKIDALKELSYLTYGRPADEVTAEIMRKYSL